MSAIISLSGNAVILFVKSGSDILAGVSKLDNLLKVSVFQRYKKDPRNKELDNSLEFSIYSGSQVAKDTHSMTSADYNNHSLFNQNETSLTPFSQLAQ